MDPHASHVEIGRKLAAYRTELAAGGYVAEGRTIPIARLVAIAPTDAEAREVARRGAQWTVTSYAKRHRTDGVDPVERYVNEVVIHGSPGRVVDELVRLREEIGLEYLLAAPLSHQSFLLLTDEVLPALARVAS
jgi:alkanesulfonate monooxygenase SsuD/methylene tetrahydromethanopterin reductase-like flavin-dependent oxidoreductase (luciferase family)